MGNDWLIIIIIIIIIIIKWKKHYGKYGNLRKHDRGKNLQKQIS